MKKFIFTVAIILFLSGYGFTQERSSTSQEMGFNLKATNSILMHLLIDENYSLIASDCNEISKHAKIISNLNLKLGPEKLGAFKSNALQLEANASVLKLLAEKIQKGVESKDINTDSLKKAAALTYGQIINSCVTCHQEFRKK